MHSKNKEPRFGKRVVRAPTALMALMAFVGAANPHTALAETATDTAQELAETREELDETREALDDTRDLVDALGSQLTVVGQSVEESHRAARGRVIYRRHCGTCHGETGDGNGPTARHLATDRPRDFTTGQYKWRTTSTGSLPTDADIMRTIQRGVPGTVMPRWQDKLSQDNVEDVTAYIKTFHARFAQRKPLEPMTVPTVENIPASTEDSVRRGRSLYIVLQCANCHGIDGAGEGPASATLKDDKGRPINAYNFTEGIFHSGGTAQDVFRTFSTGVNGTPMPSFSEALLFGRESLDPLPPVVAEVSEQEQQAIREFAESLPAAEALYALSEEEQQRHTTALRWNLVHYVLSLSAERSALWSWLTDNPYLTH